MPYKYIDLVQAVLDLETAEKNGDITKATEIRDAIDNFYINTPNNKGGGKRRSGRNKKIKRKSRKNRRTNRIHR